MGINTCTVKSAEVLRPIKANLGFTILDQTMYFLFILYYHQIQAGRTLRIYSPHNICSKDFSLDRENIEPCSIIFFIVMQNTVLIS